MTSLIQVPEQVTDETQQLSLKKPRIFADFHNADAKGRLRLNCIGTIEDFARQGIELESGQELTLYSEDLEVDGIIEYSPLENIWVAVIDWDKIREIEESDIVKERLQAFFEKSLYSLEMLSTDEFNEEEMELLISEMKKDLSYADAVLEKQGEIRAAKSYQDFVKKFGQETADEIWSAANWDEKLVMIRLINWCKKTPEVSQNLEQAGIDLEEMSNILSQNETELTSSNESFEKRT